MDDIVEEFFPYAYRSDHMDLNFDYLYLLEADGVIKWGKKGTRELITV